MDGIGVALAVFLGVGGLTAYLAGVVGLRDTRRLVAVGVRAHALVRLRPGDTHPLLQFGTEDEHGRLVEVYGPSGLVDGSRVWVRYDPADPRDLVVEGREGRAGDRLFVLLGCLALLAAPAVATLA